MTHTKVAVVLLLGVLSVVSAGCQREPQFTLVEGTITKGGKPLSEVIVEFYPESDTALPRSVSAPTDKDGRYRLRSYRGDDGAVVGSHRVCILDKRNKLNRGPALPESLLGGRPQVGARPRPTQKETSRSKEESSRIPAGYGRFNETPLRVEVQPGVQSFDFDIP